MPYNAACSKLPPIALAIALILLSACATGGSDPGGVGACPPVVEYDQALRERVAAELDLLPDGSAIEGMLADHAVLREQSMRCDRP
jgi:hypothetical protein